MNLDEIKKIIRFQSYSDTRHLVSLALSTEDAIIKFMAKSILIQEYMTNLSGRSIGKSNYIKTYMSKEFITTIEKNFDGIRVICIRKGLRYEKVLFLVKNKVVILPFHRYYGNQGDLSLYVSIYKKIEEILNEP
jgi:hypothetical protein